MSSNDNMYSLRSNGGNHGDVYTSPEVVRFILDLIGYKANRNLSVFKILEPSCGNGEFLLEIQQRLIQSARLHGFDAAKVFSENVYACEVDANKLDECINLLKANFPFRPAHFKNEDFLFSEWDTTFDFIVGNPPYIRYENIPSEIREKYRAKFVTFHYRCDIYVLFYEHSLQLLSANGRHGFICSNRWLKNEYGRKLRQLVSSDYNLSYIIDVEKLDAFQESVLAYPAITIIENCRNKTKCSISRIETIAQLTATLRYNERTLQTGDDWSGLFLPNSINKLYSIEEQGYKIGIGVATGADNVFISEEMPSLIEEDLLLPVINARDLSGDTFSWKGKYLLNPFKKDGSLIQLELYPKAKKYLETYKTRLSNRHVVKHRRVWYTLIDKIKADLIGMPKILLPDISGNKFIFVDKGEYYPAHNIYYITGPSESDLKVLASILMSSFVRRQILQLSNKMNGGFPRWQSQSIKKLKVPKISLIRPDIRHQLLVAYKQRRMDVIDTLVTEICNNEFMRSSFAKKPRQMSIFDAV